MLTFPIHNADSAPAPAGDTLNAVEAALGFVPNLFAVTAASPVALDALVELNARFAASSLTPTEREIVQLAVSVANGCAYCVAGHSAFAARQRVDADIVSAVRCGGTIADARLEALHRFVRVAVAGRGRVAPIELGRLVLAGYCQAQVCEIVLGIALKTFSNLVTGIADVPLDGAFEAFEWSPEQAAADTSRAA